MAITSDLASPPLEQRRRTGDVLLLAAPAAAAVTGMLAEWGDFRALRVPILLLMFAGVAATSYALTAGRPGARAFVTTVAVGIAAWGAAETLYVVLHALQGEQFEAERFGGQWSQALGLIAVHALALGTPTGLAAAVTLHLAALVRRGT